MTNEKIKTIEELQKEIDTAKATLKALKSEKKDIVVITKDKNSILHISVDSDLTAFVVDNIEVLKDFVVSFENEQNPTKSIAQAKVVRVTTEFKNFCRNAIKTAIENLKTTQ